MPLPSLGPIPSLILHFLNGMGPRLGNGIFPCFFTFWRGGIWQAILKSFLFFGENFLLLVLLCNTRNPPHATHNTCTTYTYIHVYFLPCTCIHSGGTGGWNNSPRVHSYSGTRWQLRTSTVHSAFSLAYTAKPVNYFGRILVQECIDRSTHS